LLKDSVPCPIPNYEKDALERPFFRLDITHAAASFNNHHAAAHPIFVLSHGDVAQMTRFAARRKGSVNQRRPEPAMRALESPGNGQGSPPRIRIAAPSEFDGEA
jgi:hypothetical protein